MFTIYSKNLAPYGDGEIVDNGFPTPEAAQEHILDQYGEPGLASVIILEDAGEDEKNCPNCGGIIGVDADRCHHCRAGLT